MLLTSIAFGFAALSMFFRKSSAFVGLLTAFTYYLTYRGGENFTEEHALLPIFAAMLVYAHLLKQGRGSLHPIPRRGNSGLGAPVRAGRSGIGLFRCPQTIPAPSTNRGRIGGVPRCPLRHDPFPFPRPAPPTLNRVRLRGG